jgi:hypothetical protein
MTPSNCDLYLMDAINLVTDRFASVAQTSSVFEMQVYAQRTIGSDDYIGALKDSIEILFAEGTTTGPFCSSEYQFIHSSPA